jgi:hypothetical protein
MQIPGQFHGDDSGSVSNGDRDNERFFQVSQIAHSAARIMEPSGPSSDFLALHGMKHRQSCQEVIESDIVLFDYDHFNVPEPHSFCVINRSDPPW